MNWIDFFTILVIGMTTGVATTIGFKLLMKHYCPDIDEEEE